MVYRLTLRSIITWAILLALILGIGGLRFTSSTGLLLGNPAAAADMSQAEFEQRVRKYLTEHPEVIGEALSRLEAKRGEQEAAEGRAALKAHVDESI